MKLSFGQNDSPMGRSFWPKDSLITHILFELCLFRYLAQSTYFRDTLQLGIVVIVAFEAMLSHKLFFHDTNLASLPLLRICLYSLLLYLNSSGFLLFFFYIFLSNPQSFSVSLDLVYISLCFIEILVSFRFLLSRCFDFCEFVIFSF